MSYFINPVEEEKCVFLTYEGATPFSEAAAAREEVGRLLAAKRWTRIMVDATAMLSVPKAVEMFDLGSALSQNVPRSARIGLVVRPDQAKHAKLLETVARNGGVSLTFFVDAAKAAAWVRGDNWPNAMSRKSETNKPQRSEENHHA